MIGLETAKRVGMVEVSPVFKTITLDMNQQDISDLVYLSRENLGLTREVLALQLNISEEELAELEIGRMTNLERAREIAKQVVKLKKSKTRT